MLRRAICWLLALCAHDYQWGESSFMWTTAGERRTQIGSCARCGKQKIRTVIGDWL